MKKKEAEKQALSTEAYGLMEELKKTHAHIESHATELENMASEKVKWDEKLAQITAQAKDAESKLAALRTKGTIYRGELQIKAAL